MATRLEDIGAELAVPNVSIVFRASTMPRTSEPLS
jgi:hypothetical protein